MAGCVDTFDLMLDLVIAPDGSLRWKDEAEYDQGRRLGIVSDADHERVQQAREEVVGMFERCAAPFEERWQAWRHDPSWPLPTLPTDALELPTR
jgi:predicted RNA-binding protein associated with RNAse of E/G family